MVVLSVMYPAGARFDDDYYFHKHLPLLAGRLGERGPSEVRILRGVAGPDGAAPAYGVMGLFTFASADDVRNALAGEHSAELLGDIANFTDGRPVVQVSEIAA